MCTPKKDALKFEAGSKQVLEITALGASVDLILKTSVKTIEAEVLRLSGKLSQSLKKLNFEVHYNESSIVNFLPKPDSAQKIAAIPSNFALRGPGLRISPHAFNTDDDIEKIIRALS
jgi:selenocysteine lyase/cysteine desulfurase